MIRYTSKYISLKSVPMKAEELTAIMDEVRFDKRAMARVLGLPYRTFQNYAYGINRIPRITAVRARLLKRSNSRFMRSLPQRVDQRIAEDFPNGFYSQGDSEE